MTNVVVLADTHIADSIDGTLPSIVWDAVDEADLVLHAGDVTGPSLLTAIERRTPVVAVLGNNDRNLDHLPVRWTDTIGGVALAMVHDSGARKGRERRMQRWFPDADVVIFGHSHEPIDAEGEQGQRLLNPGSPMQRRRQPTHSFAMLRIEGGAFTTEIIRF